MGHSHVQVSVFSILGRSQVSVHPAGVAVVGGSVAVGVSVGLVALVAPGGDVGVFVVGSVVRWSDVGPVVVPGVVVVAEVADVAYINIIQREI